MPPSDSQDTKNRLLDSAEALLAEQGIGHTSLRQITEKAGVNLALVKYHFGSKEELVAATLERRLAPINATRLRLLAEVEAEHPTGVLPLEKVLTALIRPAVELGLNGGEVGRRFLKLFGRLFSEPAESMNLMRRQMGLMIKHFDAAFARALPELTDADMAWRKIASLGVVQHSLLMLSMMDELPLHLRLPIKILKGAPKPERVLAQLVAFSAAGMRAKVPAE
jgi:AcrR family transcriptional regulator